ncbi:unnamed protein product [Gadus morhua 'NCC']
MAADQRTEPAPVAGRDRERTSWALTAGALRVVVGSVGGQGGRWVTAGTEPHCGPTLKESDVAAKVKYFSEFSVSKLNLTTLTNIALEKAI